ncbi:MAG: hemerythrin family protein [Candidatus Marinimicrobia bacterium]|nr:hemerythrin family protein [Candidatus Neomarinimicrobiota bacterium]
MENFIWTDTFSVGNELIDNQHKKLFTISQKLYESIIHSKSKEQITTILNELHSYSRTHFHDEEEIFRSLNYEKLEEHIQTHNKFESQISRFEEDIHNGKIFVPMKLMNFLENWLNVHILQEDSDIRSLQKK